MEPERREQERRADHERDPCRAIEPGAKLSTCDGREQIVAQHRVRGIRDRYGVRERGRERPVVRFDRVARTTADRDRRLWRSGPSLDDARVRGLRFCVAPRAPQQLREKQRGIDRTGPWLVRERGHVAHHDTGRSRIRRGDQLGQSLRTRRVLAVRSNIRAQGGRSSRGCDRDARIRHLARDAIVERECACGIVQAVLARTRRREQLVREIG